MAARGRRLVVGFGYRLSSCGWAATADVVNYDIKRRLGEWGSSYVDAAGPFRAAILVGSHDEAVALREHLNGAQAAQVREVVESRGLPRAKTEALGSLLEAAFHAHEQAGDRRVELRELAWTIVDGDERAIDEVRRELAESAPPKLTVPDWDDPGAFPFAAVVFDLDQTLVDSSLLETPDARRAWAANGNQAQVRQFDVSGVISPHELPRLLAERNVKTAIVTRAPADYTRRVQSLFDIHADIVKAGPGDKPEKLRAAARELGIPTSALAVVGDDASDIIAAREVGATSVGALWSPQRWPDRLQPDIACHEPELLLRIADWRRLGFIGELTLEQDPVLHGGSWIAYGLPPRRALGRYFTTSSARHSEPLTQTILASKNRNDPDVAVGRALALLGGRVAEQAGVNFVASVPPKNGDADRFSAYRQIAATAFRAEAAQLLRMTREITGYKRMSHARRAQESPGRFTADPAVQGMHVLVLDDVTTSGATFSAVEAALNAAGAVQTSCLSFSGTQD